MKACRLKVGDKVIIREAYRGYAGLSSTFKNNEILTIRNIKKDSRANGGYVVTAGNKKCDVSGYSIQYFLLYSKIVAEFNKV